MSEGFWSRTIHANKLWAISSSWLCHCPSAQVFSAAPTWVPHQPAPAEGSWMFGSEGKGQPGPGWPLKVVFSQMLWPSPPALGLLDGQVAWGWLEGEQSRGLPNAVSGRWQPVGSRVRSYLTPAISFMWQFVGNIWHSIWLTRLQLQKAEKNQSTHQR